MVKEKPNSTRIYDEDGFKKRAACICVKDHTEDEVLMVTSSRSPDKWIFPGGGVEPEEDTSMTAIREVEEEAGVVGTLQRCLGIFEVRNMERKHRTEVFVMLVKQELSSWEDLHRIGRQRRWFSIEEALKHLRLHKPLQLTYLERLLTCNRRTQ